VPNNPVQTLQALRQTFSATDLCRYGIAISKPGSQPALNPLLTDGADQITAYRRRGGAGPFELLTGRGCLSGRQLPVLAALFDPRYGRAAHRANDAIYLAFSMADVSVLLSAGFPATLATGLDHAGRRDCQRLCHQLKGRHRGPPTHNSGRSPARPKLSIADETQPRPLDIILVNWSPARLGVEPIPAVTAIRDYLRRVEEHLEVSIGTPCAWQPSTKLIDGLQFCLRHGNQADVRRVFLASVEEDVESLAPARPTKTLPDRDSESIRADLFFPPLPESALREPRKKEAWEEYLADMERDLILPLLHSAAGIRDPLDRNLLVTAAELSRLAHALGTGLFAGIARQRIAEGLPKYMSLAEPGLDQYLRVVNLLLAVTKEWHQCDQLPNLRANPGTRWRGSA
jgi:hypothetical protein